MWACLFDWKSGYISSRLEKKVVESRHAIVFQWHFSIWFSKQFWNYVDTKWKDFVRVELLCKYFVIFLWIYNKTWLKFVFELMWIRFFNRKKVDIFRTFFRSEKSGNISPNIGGKTSPKLKYVANVNQIRIRFLS